MGQISRTILIVDDSPEDRELYRRYLLRDQDYSYTILEAGLGRIRARAVAATSTGCPIA